MPPRFAYWTIIVGDQPTAFRAATQEELLPTLKQLQSRHPDAVLKWFSRGKLWSSPIEATEALRAQRQGSSGERRGPGWRPGGRHEDPRDRFKVPRDVKRQRFASRLRRDRIEEQDPRKEQQRPQRPGGPQRPAPHGDRPFRPKSNLGGRPDRGSGAPRRGGPRRGGPGRGGSGGRGPR